MGWSLYKCVKVQNEMKDGRFPNKFVKSKCNDVIRYSETLKYVRNMYIIGLFINKEYSYLTKNRM